MKTNFLFGHLCLLHHMKRVQNHPDDLISVDLFSSCLQTATAHSEPRRSVCLEKRWSHELESALESLEEKECIKKISSGDEDEILYQITYDGRRLLQSAISVLIRFLLTSVAVPIFVSVITTLITLALTKSLEP